MISQSAKGRALAADMRQQLAGIEEELASIRKEHRRRHSPKSLAEWVEWEREFGPEFDAKSPGRADLRTRVELCRSLAREYGLPYVKVKAAFADVWAAR